MKDVKHDIKSSHKDYYANVEGPIGGDDRFRWVFSKFFGAVQGQRILEIGCGEGSLLKLLKTSNQVYGVDISESGVLKTQQKGIECHHADASNEALPFEEGFFDTVITLETIEHVENPHRMLWEIKRVLKKNGTLLISIPGERVYHPFIYPGLFTRKNFSEFLISNGLRIEKIQGWGQAPLLSHWVKRVRDGKDPLLNILANIVFYIGRKRNLFMKKYFGTPLRYTYCMNFLCTHLGTTVSRVEEVASQTTPH